MRRKSVCVLETFPVPYLPKMASFMLSEMAAKDSAKGECSDVFKCTQREIGANEDQRQVPGLREMTKITINLTTKRFAQLATTQFKEGVNCGDYPSSTVRARYQ
ncbi:hypothetical protein K443DRAFT_272524 [Laccaria amethystina LaAM-08-1]|uniref:Unplaced genomic scaffold K443scaffold_175, whole genome shotgun sequence n=1 Tax=Laccaria amethystina LaAM-08-1 TaxID=1095629 RepID=A0A0C9WW45_9AGAR|nr:hypothetical protein K443DRAFT_272524 [Laccaria amethystina LaAM-08-1]